MRFLKLKFIHEDKKDILPNDIPITAFECWGCGKDGNGFAYYYDDLLDSIQKNGLNDNNIKWKNVYYAWYMIGRAQQTVFVVSIIIVVLSFFACIFLFAQRDSGFIVGPDTLLFVIVAILSMAMVLNYILKVDVVLMDDDTWSFGKTPECLPTAYVLTVFVLN